jgi:hypothetical protein
MVRAPRVRAFAAGLAIVLGTAAPSMAAFSGYYKILARHSGLAAVVQSASTSDSANVVQYAYGGAATNDEWQLVDLGTGYYKILNRNSGKALTVQSASTAEGANIFQYTFGGTATNDEWAVVSLGTGYYRITNHNSGKSAEVAGGGTTNGTNIDQRTYSGATYQQWQIVSISSTTPTPTPGATATPTPSGSGPTASQILAKMATCSQLSSGKYATDSGGSATIPVCKGNNGIWWKADMDIDCDGVSTTHCNSSADPWYQNDTSLHTSTGQPFSAETMPYIVIPSVSSTWSYSNSNIQLGACAAVIYNGKVQYGVFADTGPTTIIGEASYAMASKLGINPDPANGGTDSGVAYLVFPGSKVSPVESLSAAVSCGQSRAQTFVSTN